MGEKQPQFVVTDKRKFAADGSIREGFTPPPEEVEAPKASPVATAANGTIKSANIEPPHPPAVEETEFGIDDGEDSLPAPTAKESAEQHTAYLKSSKQLDEMLKQANPGLPPAEEVNFEALIQSLYMSAMVQLGGTAKPGEKPRVDIVGARQNIDLLGMLVDKTKGNLTTREKKLLDTLLFDLRMAFLQITNAIAKSAVRPPGPGGLV
jgi:hypothetical protein